MSKVNLALIGCGDIAAISHLTGYARLDSINIVAVCDLCEEKARSIVDRALAAERRLGGEKIEVIQQMKPKVYTDFREMLESEPKIDAVDICIPHRDHHKVAVACLEAEKDVLIEKPLGITIRACKKMIDTAQRYGKVIAVAEEVRKSEDVRAVNWAIKQGYIGDPRMLLWIDAEERLHEWGWRDHKLEAGGGWILDGGVHYADLYRYYLGEAKMVYGKTMRYEPFRYKHGPHAFMQEYVWPPGPKKTDPIKVDIEDTATATIEFENGVLVQWIYTCAAPGKVLRERVLYGTEGYIDLARGRLVSKEKNLSIKELKKEFLATLTEDERRRLFPAGQNHPEGNVIGDFCDAILNDRKPEIDGLQGLKDVAIPMAVYESAWLDEPVKVKDIEECRIENYQQEINEALNIS
ncbi:hypothetical protein DRJ00_08315 [Candidatus Aerophobetes bacterium]|uniref:Gfo/Idh/MocA family oxidoreductase n=1 Tax=Aerophobetes bacterium TaxID=2030807 RepID=A0A497E2K8_UNCAE|nr:MAG: hypothetical protein DRJ00_08315 [Candidatus Aerophobetes bacterium]